MTVQQEMEKKKTRNEYFSNALIISINQESKNKKQKIRMNWKQLRYWIKSNIYFPFYIFLFFFYFLFLFQNKLKKKKKIDVDNINWSNKWRYQMNERQSLNYLQPSKLLSKNKNYQESKWKWNEMNLFELIPLFLSQKKKVNFICSSKNFILFLFDFDFDFIFIFISNK